MGMKQQETGEESEDVEKGGRNWQQRYDGGELDKLVTKRNQCPLLSRVELYSATLLDRVKKHYNQVDDTL